MKKIAIKGTIVANDEKWIYDWFGIDAVSPQDVEDALNEAGGEDVTVEISSGGGSVFAGNEMYYLISTYSGNVIIDVVGFAGSAASVVAMAGKNRIVPTAMIMIHNVSSSARGDYHAMDAESKILKTCNKAVSNAYRIKTGMTETDLLALMDKETWLTAGEALNKKFVDEIIGDDNGILSATQPQNLYNACFANVLSSDVIAKIRNEIRPPKNDDDEGGNDPEPDETTGGDSNKPTVEDPDGDNGDNGNDGNEQSATENFKQSILII